MAKTNPSTHESGSVPVRAISYAGMFAALTLLATSVLKIPTPTFGYIHIGDAFVLLSGVFLGPALGGLAAGIGSGLSDLLGGYVLWAPGTFAVKFLTAYVTGHLLLAAAKRRHRSVVLHKKGANISEKRLLNAQPSGRGEAYTHAVHGPARPHHLLVCGIAGELVMTAGYFLYNILIVVLSTGSAGGTSLAAAAAVSLAEIPFNLVQGTSGVVLMLLLYPVFAKIHVTEPGTSHS